MDVSVDGQNAIRVEALNKSFGKVHALRGIDFVVPRGSVLGVLGPNGAGKTTAVSILTPQYLDEADELADNIIAIERGQVIAQGTSDELKDRVGGDVLAWLAGILMVFAPLAVRAYRRA